ncbi:MAG: ribbon-helix-helix protein, CopG family [Nitrospirota bacterium]
MQTIQHYERVTISLPSEISKEIEELKKELRMSKSEIFKKAFEKFLREYRRQKIQRVAEMMASEYRKDEELTVFTDLDSEEFR